MFFLPLSQVDCRATPQAITCGRCERVMSADSRPDLDNRMSWSLTWFREWTQTDCKHEKELFFRMLSKKVAPKSIDTLFGSMDTLTLNDCPRSIYDIRQNLCSEWYDLWSNEQRALFLRELESIDSVFVSNLRNLAAQTPS